MVDLAMHMWPNHKVDGPTTWDIGPSLSPDEKWCFGVLRDSDHRLRCREWLMTTQEDDSILCSQLIVIDATELLREYYVTMMSTNKRQRLSSSPGFFSLEPVAKEPIACILDVAWLIDEPATLSVTLPTNDQGFRLMPSSVTLLPKAVQLTLWTREQRVARYALLESRFEASDIIRMVLEYANASTENTLQAAPGWQDEMVQFATRHLWEGGGVEELEPAETDEDLESEEEEEAEE